MRSPSFLILLRYVDLCGDGVHVGGRGSLGADVVGSGYCETRC